MSGGSFGYLYRHDLIARRGDVARMFEALAELGFAGAAAETGKVLEHMQEISRLQAELEQVWKAVEYNQSGDWDAAQLGEALELWTRQKAERESVRLGRVDP